MTTKKIKIECPACHSRLEVDVLTGKVMKSTGPDNVNTPAEVSGERSWIEASARVDGRIQAATKKMDESLQREKGRTQDLDELFRKITKPVARKPGNHEDP